MQQDKTASHIEDGQPRFCYFNERSHLGVLDLNAQNLETNINHGASSSVVPGMLFFSYSLSLADGCELESNFILQFLVCVFASLGSVLYGYDLGVIAEAIASPSLISEFNVGSTESGAITAVFTGGAFFGAIAAGPLGDMAGRKYTIFVGALVFLLGGYVSPGDVPDLGRPFPFSIAPHANIEDSGLQTGAQTIAYLYAGRVIAGLG